MSRHGAKKKIQDLERHRARVVSELLKVHGMLRGSFGVVHTKCGRPNCWCAGGQKGHSHPRLTSSEHGCPTTRKVPRDEIPWVRNATQAYRRFRLLRRNLKRLDLDLKVLLDEFENALIEETRKGKDFLMLKAPDRKSSARKAPKRRR